MAMIETRAEGRFTSRATVAVVLFTSVCMVGCAGDSAQQGTEVTAARSSDGPPNLLIVLPDQWRGQALGFMNEDPVVTPTLDSLATEGLVLDGWGSLSRPSAARTCSPGGSSSAWRWRAP